MGCRSLSARFRARNARAGRTRLALAKMLSAKGFQLESMGSTLEAQFRFKKLALSPSKQPLRVWMSVRQDRQAVVIDAIAYTLTDWPLDSAKSALFRRRFLDVLAAIATEVGGVPDGFASPERYEGLESTGFDPSDAKRWPQIARWLGVDPSAAATDYVGGKDIFLISPHLSGSAERKHVFDVVGSSGLVSRLDRDSVAIISTVCALAMTDSEMPSRIGNDLTELYSRIVASRLLGFKHRLVYVAASSRPLVDFLIHQGRVRQMLPVRYVLRCRDCGHEKITNPEYQQAVAKSSRLRDVTGMATSALMLGPLSPFVIASRLAASNSSPAEACAHCQGTELDRTLITICSKCQTIVHDPVLRLCPGSDCGQNFLDMDEELDHWRPLREDWLGEGPSAVSMAVQIGSRVSGVAIRDASSGTNRPEFETSVFSSSIAVDRTGHVLSGRTAEEHHKRRGFGDEPPDEDALSVPDRAEVVETLINVARHEVMLTFGSLPTSATFVVPERWSAADRKVLRQAAKNRGLSPVRIVDCTLASAADAGSSLASGRSLLSLNFSDDAVHLSVLKVNDVDIESIADVHDTQAGLSAWRSPIEDWIRESSVPTSGRSLFASRNTERVRNAAMKALHDLRSATEATVFVPNVDGTMNSYFERVLTRDDYAQSASWLFGRLAAEISDLVDDATLEKSTLEAVAVVGEDVIPPALEVLLRRVLPAARIYANEPALLAARGALRCSSVKKKSVSISS